MKSKSAKFNRLIVTLIVACLPGAILFSSATLRHALSTLPWPLIALLVGTYALNVAGLVRLTARLIQLRREQS